MKNELECRIYFSRIASPQLRGLRPVFKKLARVHESFGNRFEDECAFWFAERPQMGFLSAATWLCGGATLEEGKLLKRFRSTENGGVEWRTGRGDLWLKVGKSEFHVEAKFLMSRLSEKASGLNERLSATFKKATKDVKNVPLKRRLAICFIVPLVPKSECSTSYPACRKWFDGLRGNPAYHGLVWIGARDGRKPYRGRDCDFPGILLALKEI